jgi:hypothetical protein
MLMFDSGIFSSFIPQIIMVLGYIFCLIAPGHFKSEEQTTVSSNIEFTQPTAYFQNITSATFIFQQVVVADKIGEQPKVTPPHFKPIIINIPTVFFETQGNFCSKLFSRPPPDSGIFA